MKVKSQMGYSVTKEIKLNVNLMTAVTPFCYLLRLFQLCLQKYGSIGTLHSTDEIEYAKCCQKKNEGLFDCSVFPTNNKAKADEWVFMVPNLLSTLGTKDIRKRLKSPD